MICPLLVPRNAKLTNMPPEKKPRELPHSRTQLQPNYALYHNHMSP